MNTQDIKGLMNSLEHYARDRLQYDEVTVTCRLKKSRYEIEINCDDTFQRKASYSDKVEQVLISEDFDYETELAAAGKQLFARLETVMKREERELRFGLNLIGQSLEAGASYTTHVGLEFVSSMKREQEKTMLMLPDRTGGKRAGNEETETVTLREPVSGPIGVKLDFDDEIPF